MPLTKQGAHRPPRRATGITAHHPGLEAFVPVHQLPDHGIGVEAAHEMISCELLLDGQARLNLATFVTTWMPSLGGRLMAETADKNMIDKDEYPQTAEIEARCVNILADLWHSPDHEEATGCSTTGSSEAAMLGGMALKWRWRERMQDAGKPTDRPNLVMGANVQVCWEKFCRYWDVEPRLVPMEGDRYHLGAAEAVAHCDENTIGVVAILGSTFDGSYEPVKEIAAALDKLESDKGCDVPVHVDGASGGFVAPFLQPDARVGLPHPARPVDQRLGPQVRARVPRRRLGDLAQHGGAAEDLIFDVNYLGGHMPTFALNFSRPGSEVDRAVLHVHEPRPRGLPRGACRTRRTSPCTISSGIAEIGPYQLLPTAASCPCSRSRSSPRSRTTRSSTSPTGCASAAGWCPPTRSRRTARISSVLRIVVRAGHEPRHGGPAARAPARADRVPRVARRAAAGPGRREAPGVRPLSGS